MSAEQSFPRNKRLKGPSGFAIHASGSLFKDSPDNPSVRHRPFVKELSMAPVKEPLNREDGLYGKFLSIVQNRGISLPIQQRGPYWTEGKKYNTMEAIGTSVQFIDQHGASLPETTLPPAEDMERFINGVLQEPGLVTIDRQFEMLLDITENDIVGAANLGMLATRHMSRFGERRAYPSLVLDGKKFTPDTHDDEVYELMSKWNDKIARFETYHDPAKYDGRSDGTGDSYYFWTHFFAASLLGDEGFKANAFKRGNAIMIFAKDKIAGRGGVVSSHAVSSKIGREIALGLRELAQVDFAQAN